MPTEASYMIKVLYRTGDEEVFTIPYAAETATEVMTDILTFDPQRPICFTKSDGTVKALFLMEVMTIEVSEGRIH